MSTKRNAALETAAELFLTAFNGKFFEHGALQRVEAAGIRIEGPVRSFRQTFSSPIDFELFVEISAEAVEALPGELPPLLEKVFHGMARALETVTRSVVLCEALTEEASPEGLENLSYELRRESVLLGMVTLSLPELALTFLSGVIQNAAAPRIGSLRMDALMNIDLPVSISFGSTEMALADVLRLTTGSIVEFHHLLHEPVNVVVNNCLLARGDVVVVDGNYGVRISELLTQMPK